VRKVSLRKYTVFFLIVCLCYYTIAVADETDKIEQTDLPVYIIEPGDQLLITVAGYETELTTPAIVRPDGMLAYPRIGDIRAAGLSLSQLSLTIRTKLLKLDYYVDPQVTVQLKEPSGEIIYIAGDVEEPGQKTFPRPVNIIEALAAAGWYSYTADLANAKIIRTKGKQKEVIPVDLRPLSETDTAVQDIANAQLLSDKYMLEDGAVLVIPSSIKSERINVIGYVHTPGQYRVVSAVSVVAALALGGGPVEGTANLRNIKIIRADGSLITVDAARMWDEVKHPVADSGSHQIENGVDMVYPGDSVIVLEKGRINILGNVQNQGQFAVDGEISIMEALAMSGIADTANLKKLRIVRSNGEELFVDASKIWKQRGQEFEETLTAGDTLIVPRSLAINWGAISTVVLILSTLYAIFK